MGAVQCTQRERKEAPERSSNSENFVNHRGSGLWGGSCQKVYPAFRELIRAERLLVGQEWRCNGWWSMVGDLKTTCKRREHSIRIGSSYPCCRWESTEGKPRNVYIRCCIGRNLFACVYWQKGHSGAKGWGCATPRKGTPHRWWYQLGRSMLGKDRFTSSKGLGIQCWIRGECRQQN